MFLYIPGTSVLSAFLHRSGLYHECSVRAWSDQMHAAFIYLFKGFGCVCCLAAILENKSQVQHWFSFWLITVGHVAPWIQKQPAHVSPLWLLFSSNWTHCHRLPTIPEALRTSKKVARVLQLYGECLVRSKKGKKRLLKCSLSDRGLRVFRWAKCSFATWL